MSVYGMTPRKAMVTGGDRGLGEGMARALARFITGAGLPVDGGMGMLPACFRPAMNHAHARPD